MCVYTNLLFHDVCLMIACLGMLMWMCCCMLKRVRMVAQPKALDHSTELFDTGDTDKDGKLTLAELRQLMNQASKQYSHLEEHARFLDA